MPHVLSLQNTYHNVELALFNDTQQLAMRSISKIDSSALLMPSIKELLSEHGLAFSHLSFIAVNQGPGPFTTLRVVIATVNGISFATSIPLIGIDGLDAFLDEYRDPSYNITVALFNAFNQDAYFGIDATGSREKGCTNIDQLLDDLKNRYRSETVRFIGSGALYFKDKIITVLGAQAYIPHPTPEHPSVQAIAMAGLDFWKDQSNLSYQVLPLYLKTHSRLPFSS